ncbi:MAG: hypothetical protein RSB28_07770, partial [Oscillospiraceae bacterium]
ISILFLCAALLSTYKRFEFYKDRKNSSHWNEIANKNKQFLSPIVYFYNGVVKDIKPKPNGNLYDSRELIYNAKFIVSDGSLYNLEDEKSIRSIKIPHFKDNAIGGDLGVTGCLDYDLRMKAGSLRNNGLNELSIILLKKAMEIMQHSAIYWNKKDYMRISHWLYEDGRFDEAEKEEEKINKMFENINQPVQLKDIVVPDYYSKNDDLIEMEYYLSCSPDAALYRGRVFSLYGKDNRFPKLTQEILDTGLSYSYFLYDTCKPIYEIYSNKKIDIIKFSNRPFMDDRTEVEKQNYNDFLIQQKNEIKKESDRKEYYRLKYAFPDMAPKSFGGYRRMKNLNSKTYQNIVSTVHNNR